MTSLLARNQSANNDKINRQSAIGLSVDVAGGAKKPSPSTDQYPNENLRKTERSPEFKVILDNEHDKSGGIALSIPFGLSFTHRKLKFPSDMSKKINEMLQSEQGAMKLQELLIKLLKEMGYDANEANGRVKVKQKLGNPPRWKIEIEHKNQSLMEQFIFGSTAPGYLNEGLSKFSQGIAEKEYKSGTLAGLMAFSQAFFTAVGLKSQQRFEGGHLINFLKNELFSEDAKDKADKSIIMEMQKN